MRWEGDSTRGVRRERGRTVLLWVPDVGRVGVRSDIGLALGVGGVVYETGLDYNAAVSRFGNSSSLSVRMDL